MKKILGSTWLATITMALSAIPVRAAEKIMIEPAAPFAETITKITLGSLLSGLITLILVVAGLLFFFMLVIGGIQWMTSGGDKAATEAARGRITAALIGLVIVFAAWAIAKLIEGVFGFNILTEFEIPRFY